MAKKVTARVEIRAEDKASATVGKVQSRFQKFSSFMKVGFVAAVGVAAVAIRKLAQTMEEATKAASVQEVAVQKVATSLAAIGETSPKAVKEMEAFAAALQETTTVGDETILGLTSLAISFTNNAEQARKLTEAAINFSQGAGISMEESVRRLGRTLGGSVADVANFDSRIRDLTAEEIKNGAAIDLLGEKYAGFAADATNTYAGAMQQLTNAQGDTLESLGALISQSDAYVEAIKRQINVQQEMQTILNATGEGGDALGTVMGELRVKTDEFKLGLALLAADLLGIDADAALAAKSMDILGDSFDETAESIRKATDEMDDWHDQLDESDSKEFEEAILDAAKALDKHTEAAIHNKESIRLLNEAEEEARRIKEQGLTPAVDRLAAAEDSLVTSTDDATQATREQIRAQQDLQRELDRTEQQTERTILTNERAARAQRAASGRETFAEINARGESIVPGGNISERRTVFTRL